MLEEIERVKNQGYNPVIFIDDLLIDNIEIKELIKKAKKLKIEIFTSSTIEKLRKIRKAYIFRYGYISPFYETSIKRKKEIIVSGNLKID